MLTKLGGMISHLVRTYQEKDANRPLSAGEWRAAVPCGWQTDQAVSRSELMKWASLAFYLSGLTRMEYRSKAVEGSPLWTIQKLFCVVRTSLGPRVLAGVTCMEISTF